MFLTDISQISGCKHTGIKKTKPLPKWVLPIDRILRVCE